ncbi:MAG: hypothetical protein HY547_04230 [Elusimicrobia bacterium]|nr:hypothetical protein [Elusimicrobiota bacterium]
MRQVTTLKLLRRFMELLGSRLTKPANVYFTGGVTALLHGWRETTIDVDLSATTGEDGLLRQIPVIKEELKINVELASPSDFIPELPGWKDRSVFIASYGVVHFYHYDPYAQVLSKIERGHAQDVEDIKNFIQSGLVDPIKLIKLFQQIKSELYRYPAIDPDSFGRAVTEAISGIN